ncbi:hypothetical protein DM860_015633 [Cuscuta australis]|uniref:Uncharacterized protein n=1 Tax=Cuscuta australis TaxID=267555 RepID=A0A328DJK3_9ASTE|nr:hypothetical protein DM860_015633 [Cuscuta australis]
MPAFNHSDSGPEKTSVWHQLSYMGPWLSPETYTIWAGHGGLQAKKARPVILPITVKNHIMGKLNTSLLLHVCVIGFTKSPPS